MADEWQQDISEDFVNIVGLPNNIVTHMFNAVHVSYYKYGSVLTKDENSLKKFQALSLKKYEETGNSEKLIDALNYEMFLYMRDGQKEHIDNAREFAAKYKEEDYRATDSNDSVVVIRKPVSQWLRERIYDSTM